MRMIHAKQLLFVCGAGWKGQVRTDVRRLDDYKMDQRLQGPPDVTRRRQVPAFDSPQQTIITIAHLEARINQSYNIATCLV
jgi:hypothetical protein